MPYPNDTRKQLQGLSTPWTYMSNLRHFCFNRAPLCFVSGTLFSVYLMYVQNISAACRQALFVSSGQQAQRGLDHLKKRRTQIHAPMRARSRTNKLTVCTINGRGDDGLWCCMYCSQDLVRRIKAIAKTDDNCAAGAIRYLMQRLAAKSAEVR